MALATQHFDLYIIPNTTPPPVLDISQYDTSRTFVGHVKDIHGKSYTLPNGTTALLEGRNGNGIIFRLNATVNNDTLTFTPDDILTDTPGRIHATISLDSTGQQLSPLRIIFNIQRAGITKEEKTTNPDFKDAVAAAFQAYIDEHGSGGSGGSGEMNVQSDWNQGNTNADDYIKNKPTRLSQFQNDSGYITSSDISNKVDKVSGKGLSTNDYTTAEKTKLSNIAAGAQVNTIEAITLNGSTVQPDSNKVVNLTISGGGTSSVTSVNGKTGAVILKTSDLTNDSGYLTSHQDISGKVDKVSGKGLSTNDYTTAEKNKLSGIASGAQVNTIETIKVNGTALTPDSNKAVNISISSSGSSGLPSGGTTGQVLTKTSSGEAWQNVPTELPSGGSTGQVLKKTASGVAWQNESGSSSDSTAFEIPVSTTQNGYSTAVTAAEIIANAKNCYISQGGFIFKNISTHYFSANEVTISFSNGIGFENLPFKGYIIQANTTNNTITITQAWANNPYEIPLVYNNNTNTWQVDPSANLVELGVFQNYDNCIFVINDKKLPVVRALRDDSEGYAELIAIDYLNGSNSCEQTIWKVVAENISSNVFEVSVNTYSISPYLIRVYLNSATFIYEVDETPLELISVCENCEVLFESQRYKHSYTNKISSSEVIMHFITGTDGGSEGFIIHAIVGSGVTVSWVDNISLPSGGSVGQVLKKTSSGVAWQNESGGSGSGSGAFVIPIFYDGIDYTTTATAAEMIAHKNDLAVEYSNMHFSLKSSFSSNPDAFYVFYFSCESPETQRIDAEWFRIECSNGAVMITKTSKDILLLPSIAASDEGKFLRAVNGVWTAQTVQTWQGGNY